MKKRALSILLTTAMVAAMFTGCGNKTTGGDDKTAGSVSNGGKVLNIYCWNNEFRNRIKDHYSKYETTDDEMVGKIGDVTVKWHETPNAENAYQNALDLALMDQAYAAADDKVDMFLVEADYALNYVDSSVTANVKDLGITDADLANQYQYTKDVVTDGSGAIKGVTWQACPGLLFYNREACKDIWGTDDPAEIQEKVKDWDTFMASAAEAKEAGYTMVSSVNDTYRVYSNNVSSKWAVDGKINIDANIKKWVDDSKAMVDAGYAGTHALWGDDWNKGFYPDGNVVCYFGPAWFVNFSMANNVETSIAYNGGWGATEGPQSFFWGGTWICAATGTDNADEIKDIMLTMTTDATVMKGIVEKDNDFVNNKPAMEEMAKSAYECAPLGGQNPLPMYVAATEAIDLKNLSAYDQGCNEQFQNAMKDYFEGNATYDEALDTFYSKAIAKYPALSK
ncbi:MAG: carbohydrate ABC transporter substrate-binding protein [Lachnospiraceae bacterium]|nr:carbohydrate ABC transporter substrate-binding protein [Lachnospiraceae bacterium]